MRQFSLRKLESKLLVLAALLAGTLTAKAACTSTHSSPDPVSIDPPATEPTARVPIAAFPPKPVKPVVEPTPAVMSVPVITPIPVGNDLAVPPPGLVLIPGGRTVIGMGVKDVEKLLEDNYGERKLAGAYISGTPQFKREVAEFALMVTEVTNEQFAAYIRSTGNRPPELWGTEAINAASTAFLTEQGRLRQEAKEEGRPLPDRQKFDRQLWWDQNWKDASWAIPKGEKHRPVVYIDYEDAQSYAQWAGLRLMTEFEFQRAVRGSSDAYYTWGEDWKDKHAATLELSGNSQTSVVGSFEKGATAEGVYDLIGNAWEWTSSPYVAFPKYKAQTFKMGSGRKAEPLDAIANWDANKRVCVGGCYHSNKFIARCTTRRGSSRSQTADAITFRCAAGLAPGVDIADRIMADELDAGARPSNPDGAIQYAGPDTLAVDRWTSVEPADEDKPVPGYDVITGYDYVIFTPVEKLWGVDVNDLNKRIIENGPEPIGFLSTNQRLLNPDVEPGTYMISYRCKGAPAEDNSLKGKGKKGKKDKEPEAVPDEEETIDPWDLGDYEVRLGLDKSKDYFIFFNQNAEIVGFVEAIGFDKKSGKIKSAGSAQFFEKDYTVTEQDEAGEDVEVEVHEQWLRFDANIRARAARRGFQASIAVQVEEDLDATSFRMSKEE